MDEVIIEYQLTWREWRRIYWGATTKKIISAFILFFAFFFGVSVLVFANHRQVWDIVIAALALVSIVSNFWIAPRRYWNSSPGVQEAQRVAVSDDGVVRTSASLDETLGWEHYRSVKDERGYFVLVGRPGYRSVYLPKRGVATPEDEGVLLSLILRHVPSP